MLYLTTTRYFLCMFCLFPISLRLFPHPSAKTSLSFIQQNKCRLYNNHSLLNHWICGFLSNVITAALLRPFVVLFVTSSSFTFYLSSFFAFVGFGVFVYLDLYIFFFFILHVAFYWEFMRMKIKIEGKQYCCESFQIIRILICPNKAYKLFNCIKIFPNANVIKEQPETWHQIFFFLSPLWSIISIQNIKCNRSCLCTKYIVQVSMQNISNFKWERMHSRRANQPDKSHWCRRHVWRGLLLKYLIDNTHFSKVIHSEFHFSTPHKLEPNVLQSRRTISNLSKIMFCIAQALDHICICNNEYEKKISFSKKFWVKQIWPYEIYHNKFLV